MPDLTTLESLLEEWRDLKAYVIPMTDNENRELGNNGDRLMHEVFYRILDLLNISRASSKDEAQVLFVPPNGALLEIYSFPGILADRLRGAENKPLVIFPSSAYFPSQDPSFMFENRTATTTWILREKNSFDHLVAKWQNELVAHGVELVLDHDVVASGHQFVPDIIGSLSVDGVLIAARLDKESRAVRTNEGKAPSPTSVGRRLLKAAASFLPYGRVYTALARRARKGDLVRAGNDLTRSIDPQDFNKSKLEGAVYADISSPQYATFDEYKRYIASSSVVVTDRLHVGLPAAIVGKDVVLVEAGYHKLGGVYEQSLRLMPNVQFRQKG